MYRYYCFCCGCDFNEEETSLLYPQSDVPTCPVCGASYDEEDESIIERYKED